MTTLHEQARAEQRREYGSVWDVLVPEVGRTVGWIIDGVIDDVVAAHTRVVRLADELDALPVGTVVLGATGTAWQKDDERLDLWWTPGNDDSFTSEELIDFLYAPFRVLYEPEETR